MYFRYKPLGLILTIDKIYDNSPQPYCFVCLYKPKEDNEYKWNDFMWFYNHRSESVEGILNRIKYDITQSFEEISKEEAESYKMLKELQK